MIFRRRTSEATVNKLEAMLGPTLGAVVSFFLEILQIAVLAVVIIFITRHFLVLPFIVKGASMEPNFYDNEYLIVDEVTFRLREPERGEIVVFHPPTESEEQYYIKRVIGLPGETVIVADGKVTIENNEYPNGVVLDEAYLDDITTLSDRTTLGPNEYYLMGDNRDHSLDSRSFGAVPKANIVGRVWLRGLPLERAQTFPVPDYQYE